MFLFHELDSCRFAYYCHSEGVKERETDSNRNRLFSKKDLRKLIIPLILEQTLAITVGMADTMMISSAGEAAVSGVSLVDMFNNLIISVLAALATGGAVVTSQCIGAGRREEACRSARQLVFTEAAITIGISVLVLLFTGRSSDYSSDRLRRMLCRMRSSISLSPCSHFRFSQCMTRVRRCTVRWGMRRSH